MGKLALEGIRVADFSWVLAGPYAAKMLADQGAQVIKIETSTKLDGVRAYGPWRDKLATPPDGSGFFDIHNRNKLSITLNLNTPRGQEIAKRLIKISDVAIENFSVRGMQKFGLPYPVLAEINPRLVMISMQGMGHTGPQREYLSFGNTLQPLMGLTHLTGYPDGQPVGTGVSYPDFVAAVHSCFAILSALRYREITGKGQWIDMSQYETSVALLGPAILDYTANGRVQERQGNRLEYAAPHNVYQCKGDNRWAVIAAYDDEEWKSICNVIGNAALAADSKFATLAARQQNIEELDNIIAKWTVNLTPEEVMERMQKAGVPSGVVQNVGDMQTRDPHMKARGFYEEAEHPIAGLQTLEGIPFKLSETPGSIRKAAPCLGEDTEMVLKEIIGLTDAEMDEALIEGALT